MNSTSSLSFLDKWKSSQAYQKGIAGTCAVATTATIMFPFDLIKNRLQYQKSNNIKYTGVLNAFKIIIKEETIFGLFKGLNVRLAYALPASFITFSTLELSKSIINSKNTDDNSKNTAIITAISLWLLPRTMQTVIRTPFDVIKQYLQLNRMFSSSSSKAPSTTTRDIIKHLYQEFGIFGLFRGINISLLRDIPFAACYFWLASPITLYIQKQSILLKDNIRTCRFIGGGLA